MRDAASATPVPDASDVPGDVELVVTPPRTHRSIVALVLGFAVAVATWDAMRGNISDFRFWHLGARLLLDGIDPYAMRPGDAAWPLPDPLYYPLPTLLATLPLTGLSVPVAAALVLGASSALLAWVLSRDGWFRLWFFASPGFIMAVQLGQWTPVLCVAALVPSLGALLLVKPNLGGPLFLWRPTVPAAVGCTLLLALSLAIMPGWPVAWRDNLAFLTKHPAPLFTRQGAFLWLALLRWRSPDARLLLITAAAPQLLFFSDQLPLMLVARSRRELAGAAAAGLMAWIIWYASVHDGAQQVSRAAPFVLTGIYLPALAIVLLRRSGVTESELAR